MKVRESQLRRVIREVITEFNDKLATYQSHTNEPKVGESVVNVNPKCKHVGSEGIVTGITAIPGDAGTVVRYEVINVGNTFQPGDVLEKTLDQLAPLAL
jgi:hypothetical protein